MWIRLLMIDSNYITFQWLLSLCLEINKDSLSKVCTCVYSYIYFPACQPELSENLKIQYGAPGKIRFPGFTFAWHPQWILVINGRNWIKIYMTDRSASNWSIKSVNLNIHENVILVVNLWDSWKIWESWQDCSLLP